MNKTNTTYEELISNLWAVRGATICSLESNTKPDLVGGKSCKLHGLEKRSKVSGTINFHYGNAVNKVLAQNAENIEDVELFVPQPRKWGVRLFNNERTSRNNVRMLPFVSKIKTIGQTKTDLVNNVEQQVTVVNLNDLLAVGLENLYLEVKVEKSLSTEYSLRGSIIPNEEVYPFLRKRDEMVVLREYSLQNLAAITLNGRTLSLPPQESR